MNAYDGERMGELMSAQGLTPAEADSADFVILNTCRIRAKVQSRAAGHAIGT